MSNVINLATLKSPQNFGKKLVAETCCCIIHSNCFIDEKCYFEMQGILCFTFLCCKPANLESQKPGDFNKKPCKTLRFRPYRV